VTRYSHRTTITIPSGVFVISGAVQNRMVDFTICLFSFQRMDSCRLKNLVMLNISDFMVSAVCTYLLFPPLCPVKGVERGNGGEEVLISWNVAD